MKKFGNAFIALVLMSSTSTFASDTCFGYNFTNSNADDYKALQQKVKVIAPFLALTEVLAMAPSGTCETVVDGKTISGDSYYRSSIVDEKKFNATVKSLASLVKKAKGQMINTFFNDKNPYTEVGTYFLSSDSGLIGYSDVSFSIYQPLSSTSALYKNKNDHILLYKDKSGTPTQLNGIFKATGVQQFKNAYGEMVNVLVYKKVTDFKDSSLKNVQANRMSNLLDRLNGN